MGTRRGIFTPFIGKTVSGAWVSESKDTLNFKFRDGGTHMGILIIEGISKFALDVSSDEEIRISIKPKKKKKRRLPRRSVKANMENRNK